MPKDFKIEYDIQSRREVKLEKKLEKYDRKH